MPARFATIDRDSPFLLPSVLRDRVGADHTVHYIMDAVEALDLSVARVNERGTGSAQYEIVAMDLLCADTHPDHDSICKVRRENKELPTGCFHQVLELAAETRVLKVGDISASIDGTKLPANASKHSAMSHEHFERQLNPGIETAGRNSILRLNDRNTREIPRPHPILF